ncbi:MAG: hypothetical protein QOC82_657 [Frankiaceae bacterium]|jgi:hypothetical protein|nr:hypothetical protein [Frankiaceae bacterium]
MRRTSVRAILLAVPISLSLAVVPPSRAGLLPNAYQQAAIVLAGETVGVRSNSGGQTTHGGCFFVSIEQPILTNGVDVGIIGLASTATDARNNVVSATVKCFIRVNGVPIPGTVVADSDSDVQVGLRQMVFDEQRGTLPVALCEDDTIGGTALPEQCIAAIDLDVPPQQVFDALREAGFSTDPGLCPVLKSTGDAIGGGIPGVLEIRSDGDVYAADPLGEGYNPIYDCPPYGVF